MHSTGSPESCFLWERGRPPHPQTNLCQVAFFQARFYLPISYLYSAQSCTKTFLSARLALCSTRRYLGNLSQNPPPPWTPWGRRGHCWESFAGKSYENASLISSQTFSSLWLQGSLVPRVIISTCNGPSQLSCLAFLRLLFRSTTPNGNETHR